MEWLEQLRGKTVGLDSAPLIYFIEKNPEFHPRVRPFFLAMQRGDFEVVTSTMTVAEVMVHPFKRNDAELTEMYRDILQNAAHLRTVPFTTDIAEITAPPRRPQQNPHPRRHQIATAVAANADFFLTNDAELPMLSRPTVLVLKNLE